MATRTIVTSHPEIACEVCGRRLLRGEQPDVFLSGGQRRMVCELCVPRATHEGWLRETEERTLTVRPSGPRRTRSLLGRLRQLREPGPPLADEDPGDEGRYDFLDPPLPSVAPPAPAVRHPGEGGERQLERALGAFNSGEHPRRIAGVARSLGSPSVCVSLLDAPDALVTVVVAWDLCWYRYQVDLDDEQSGARLVAQGTELDELRAQEGVANAAADERGELSLLA